MYTRLLCLFALFSLVALVFGAPTPVVSPETDFQVSTEDIGARSVIEARANSGKGTWYNPSVGIGACGWRNKDSELVVALGSSKFKKGKCGQSITVKSGGKSVNVKVVDMCPSCGGGSLDLSPAAFKKLAPLSRGVIQVIWASQSTLSPKLLILTSLLVAVIGSTRTLAWLNS
ncbi:hypothetical protein OPQ81_011534 [Rhizoctonia solani]|nr:hypothetical protein OPQ81_011534 [Rhizoctonia solani]